MQWVKNSKLPLPRGQISRVKSVGEEDLEKVYLRPYASTIPRGHFAQLDSYQKRPHLFQENQELPLGQADHLVHEEVFESRVTRKRGNIHRCHRFVRNVVLRSDDDCAVLKIDKTTDGRN